MTRVLDWLGLSSVDWLRLLGFYVLVLGTIAPWLLVLRLLLKGF